MLAREIEDIVGMHHLFCCSYNQKLDMVDVKL